MRVINVDTETGWSINEPAVEPTDRCDRCGAAPKWIVSLVSGPLLLCNHDFVEASRGNKIQEKALAIAHIDGKD